MNFGNEFLRLSSAGAWESSSRRCRDCYETHAAIKRRRSADKFTARLNLAHTRRGTTNVKTVITAKRKRHCATFGQKLERRGPRTELSFVSLVTSDTWTAAGISALPVNPLRCLQRLVRLLAFCSVDTAAVAVVAAVAFLVFDSASPSEIKARHQHRTLFLPFSSPT